jgi:hypothetical protein
MWMLIVKMYKSNVFCIVEDLVCWLSIFSMILLLQTLSVLPGLPFNQRAGGGGFNSPPLGANKVFRLIRQWADRFPVACGGVVHLMGY